mmetsp:Transcript_3834/g.6492  ORF Transcript_3834/g.6492 Transcript_3834/m.6492 type:complete len:264 (+) Transcript_3834:58-849(+)
MANVTPADVNTLQKPTEGFLCSMSDNKYGIEFLSFCISDYDTKDIIFEVGKGSPPPPDMSLDFSTLGEDMYRKIKYTFSEDVLKLPFIQTTLQFGVGDNEVHDFRMIERHYFRGKLVKSFDFEFGFCIPGSVNCWDAIYSMPPLDAELVSEMVNHPYETQSDSFYFVDNTLVMHNKASYKYIREDAAQEKKSYADKFGSKGAKGAKTAKAAKKASAGGSGGDDIYIDTEENADGKGPEAKGSGRGAKSGAKVAQAWSKEEDYF